jgi:hypothetical protein
MEHTTVLRPNYAAPEIVPHVFFQKLIILATPPAGEKKFVVTKNQNTWPFEIESPTSAPLTFTVFQNLNPKHPAVSFTVEASIRTSFSGLNDRKNIIFRPSVLINIRTAVSCSKVSLILSI